MHPLEHIRVADFTTMINGPYATMMLSDMGADVIKIEPPYGDSWRGVGGGFLACNRGKRAVSIDLKKPEGRDVVYDIIKSADMVVENARWGVWQKLGLDYESVLKIKPDLIYLSILGHGSAGPFSKLPGYDPVLQTRSGQMVGQGGIGKPPVYHIIAINDQAAPMIGAYGAVLALLSKIRKGKSQRIETSLTHAAIALQAGEFLDYEGIDRKLPGDTGLLGLSAVKRHYQTKDGRWIFIFCNSEDHWQSLLKATGLENLSNDERFKNAGVREKNDHDLVDLLAEVFITQSADHWIDLLNQEKVPVALGQSADEVLKDPHCEETDIFDDQMDPTFGMVRLVGVGPKFSDIKGIIRRPAPLLGEHTEEVLKKLGYGEEKIAALKSEKIIFTHEE